MHSKNTFILLIIFILGWSEVFCQREDYHWFFGYSDRPSPDTNFGRAEILFTDTSFDIKKTFQVIHKLNFTNASICDSGGKLLFYTNGLEVYNNKYQVMLNGDDLNPGEFANGHEKYGYPLSGAALILPFPKQLQKYFIIHHTINRVPFIWYALDMFTSLVDMNLAGGYGDVVYKNKSLLSDSLLLGSLTACQHANGRDWWIPCFFYRGGKCFMFLLDPSGIKLHHIQDIPFEFSPSGTGQAHFSPDGSRYAFLHYCSQDYRELFYAQFDRCSGLFSDINYFVYPRFELIGIAFSPNNRFLYFGTGNELFQIDFQDSLPYAQKVKIDSIDGFQSFPGFPSYFHLMQLAPDNKIYICNGRSPTYLSTIENPDVKGRACNVRQHNISIVANSTLPNFPYFRLGALKGSPCDTIGLVNTSHADPPKKWSIYYNRSQQSIVIDDPGQHIILAEIYSFNGSLVSQQHFQPSVFQKTMDAQQLQNGMYFIQLRDKNGLSFAEKILILQQRNKN